MKRVLSIHILTALLCATAGLMSSSCIYDRNEWGDESGDAMQFILRISAVGADAVQQPTDIVETVNSLRVIIIDKESGRLDVNEKVSMPAAEYTAKNFSYVFIRSLKSGDKRVFLIANEDSVDAVKLTDNTDLPKDIPLTNLAAMLNYFKAASEDTNTEQESLGNTFADALNRVYFKCDYATMTSGNKIALPYSAYYELNVVENSITQIEQSMYLVPVATKFDFVFTNYRRHKAYVDDIVISSINLHNYLNAQLAESEQFRTKPGETQKVWWIDWLEECARGSQTADDIEPDAEKDKTGGYNGRWGWIEQYTMPVPDEMTELQLNQEKKIWSMDGLVYIANPSKIGLGPFYVPESFNIPVPDSDSDAAGVADPDAVQSYSLTFMVHDETEDSPTTLSGYVIDTLKSLFRATHVIIYVEFYESKAEIFVEIKPWEEKLFLGYVQQDEDYN